jgi:hypothetical protein
VVNPLLASAVTLVDSTGSLPQRVILRTTPCEISVVSVDDKDTCFLAIPYNDLTKWELQASGEIAISARTRARLTAKADRFVCSMPVNVITTIKA